MIGPLWLKKHWKFPSVNSQEGPGGLSAPKMLFREVLNFLKILWKIFWIFIKNWSHLWYFMCTYWYKNAKSRLRWVKINVKKANFEGKSDFGAVRKFLMALRGSNCIFGKFWYFSNFFRIFGQNCRLLRYFMCTYRCKNAKSRLKWSKIGVKKANFWRKIWFWSR